MSRVRHSPASPRRPRAPRTQRPLRLSAVAVSVAIHAIALGAIAAFSVAPPLTERAPEVEARFAAWVPEIAPEDEVPPPAAGDAARPEEMLDATESAELEDPLAETPEFAAPEVIALASRFGSGSVRIGPRRVRGGTGQAAGASGTGGGSGRDGDSASASSAAVEPSVAPSAPPPAPAEVVRVAARVLRTARPEYPERAREGGIEGRVVLVAEILANGTVGEIEVLTSSGCAALDEAAADCVRRRWRFAAAQADGVAVRARVRLPVFVFRIDD